MDESTSDQREWTPFDRDLAHLIQTSTAPRTAACLEPDVLLDLIDGNENAPANQPALTHLAECAYCRREYVQMRADLLEADTLRTHPPVAVVPTSVSPALPAPAASPNLAPTVATTASLPIGGAQARAPAIGITNWWRRLSAPRVFLPVGALALASFLCGWLVSQMPLTQAQQKLAQQDARWKLERQELETRLAQALTPQQARRAQEAQRREVQQARTQAEQQAHRVQQARKAQVALERRLTALEQDNSQLRQSAAESSLPVLAQQFMLPSRQIAALKVSDANLMGSSDVPQKIDLRSPVATYVLTLRPRFRWQPVMGATRYQWILTDDATADEIARKEIVGATECEPDHDLKPARRYRWWVKAFHSAADQQPFAMYSARFGIRDEIARQRLKSVATSGLQSGKLYEQAGLLEEAEWAYRTVSSAYPAAYREAQARLRNLEHRY